MSPEGFTWGNPLPCSRIAPNSINPRNLERNAGFMELGLMREQGSGLPQVNTFGLIREFS